MLIFDPSKLRFFKKDDDGEPGEKDVGVKTFFDTLDLNSKGGGGESGDKKKKDKDNGDEDNDDDDNGDSEDDDNDDNKSTLSPELIAMQEQLKTSQEQTAKLMAIIEKKDDSKEEEEELEDPFENDSFDDLSKAMDWDDKERKAMKAFMQNALDYQSQTTLTTATASVTDIVNSSMSQAAKKKAVQKQFFTENPKLKPVKDYVSTVASGIFKEYKALGKTLNPAEILKEAASRAYKVLGIDPKAKEKDEEEESESDPNPAFPSNKGSSKKRNQKVNKTRDQKMISSMIDL